MGKKQQQMIISDFVFPLWVSVLTFYCCIHTHSLTHSYVHSLTHHHQFLDMMKKNYTTLTRLCVSQFNWCFIIHILRHYVYNTKITNFSLKICNIWIGFFDMQTQKIPQKRITFNSKPIFGRSFHDIHVFITSEISNFWITIFHNFELM